MKGPWSKTSRSAAAERSAGSAMGRVLAVKIFLSIFFVVVVLRLVQIQLIESSEYHEAARRQYEDDVELPATRGSLYDRLGRVLVSSAMDVSFGADPKMLGNNAPTVARRFAQAFGKPAAAYLAKLSPPTTNFVWLERHARLEYANLIKSGEFVGMVQIEEPRRIYHSEQMAGQVFGFTDIDNKGISGLELQFDGVLRGKSGHVIMHRDGLGRRWTAVDYPRVDPVNGKSIVLTIDRDYQAIAEEELRKGIEQYRAESGLVVILDPGSGRILAMVNYPPIDPARAGTYDQSYTRNRVVTDMFEPGSVFKIVTASVALEQGLVKPEEKFYAEQGEYRVPGGLRTIKDVHPYGILTFREAMEFSSNIVMAKVSDRIGAERMFRGARDFGFGTETGVELPGEISGELKKPTEWWATTLNSIAYGYGVGVTAIQIAAAYAVIANGGILYQPTILNRVLVGEEPSTDNRPQVIRRVISQETARTVTQFLTGVVERGTGTQARVEGMTVAGKTGTTRKVLNGKYVPGSYTATFAGFFPAENPKAVCVVILETRSDSYTGGRVSAPIFRSIAQKVVALSEHFTEDAIAQAENDTLPGLPDVVDLKVENAVPLLESGGFEVELTGSGEFVLGQSPLPGTKLLTDGAVRLHTGDIRLQPGVDEVLVPDLGGLSLRRAMSRLMMLKLEMRVEGSGMVLAQSPAPGEKVKIKTPIHVRCRPGSFAATPN